MGGCTWGARYRKECSLGVGGGDRGHLVMVGRMLSTCGGPRCGSRHRSGQDRREAYCV